MTTDLGVAGVTRALRNLLGAVATADYSDLPDDTRPTAEIRITTLPLDRVRNGNGEASQNSVNLFLYHAEASSAYRNMDVPRTVRSGEEGRPPLALNLHYLLTAYGQADNELVSHVLLGAAMRVFHDHPVLSREELHLALPPSGLDAQFERLRITPQPVTLDEMSKLWTGFQSEYRLSAAYQVSVVLIESLRPGRAALPVLRRGADDRGPVALAAPGPSLIRVREILDPTLPTRPPHGKPAAEFGDILVLEATNLGSGPISARVRHPRLQQPIELALLPDRSATEARVALPGADDPEAPARWPAGFYTIELIVERSNVPRWTSNRLPFMLAPSLESLAPTSAAAATQPFDLAVTCVPQVFPGQRAALLLGDREISPSSVTTPADPDEPTELEFPIDGLAQGAYLLRLRVDGVDSIPIDFTITPPEFDAALTLTIT